MRRALRAGLSPPPASTPRCCTLMAVTILSNGIDPKKSRRNLCGGSSGVGGGGLIRGEGLVGGQGGGLGGIRGDGCGVWSLGALAQGLGGTKS